MKKRALILTSLLTTLSLGTVPGAQAVHGNLAPAERMLQFYKFPGFPAFCIGECAGGVCCIITPILPN